MQGGAIYADNGAKVEINVCTFERNQATYNGGAINAAGSGCKVEIHASSFISNKATDPDFSTGNGGAIYISSGSLIISDTTFKSNSAYAVSE